MFGKTSDPGIVPRGIEFLIHQEKFSLCCSFFEIYNETFIDLLREESEQKQNPVEIHLKNIGSGKSAERVSNLKEVQIQSIEQFQEAFKSANERRATAETLRNQDSSRSHAVIQISLKGLSCEKNKQIESNIILLDFAGCENSNDHLVDNNGSKRSAEMSNINKSINRFETVLDGLGKKQAFVDFRSSKLTHLLKPCLSTNTKTLIITTAAQELKYISASKAALKVASSANRIKMNVNFGMK